MFKVQHVLLNVQQVLLNPIDFNLLMQVVYKDDSFSQYTKCHIFSSQTDAH